MSKLTRAVMKVFGGTATVGQIKQFGSLAAAAPLSTTDPVVIQALSEFSDGWFAAVLGGNSPAIEDMNALCFLFARQLAYLGQTGIAEWDATTTYYIGSLATAVGTGVIYVSLTNTNLNNAVTDTAHWKPLLVPVFDVVLGSAAQVTQGRATHSTWAAAIAAASAGGSIVVLPGSWTENVSLSKQLKIVGAGYGSYLDGTFLITGTTKHCTLADFRMSGVLTVDVGCQANNVNGLFSTQATPYADNSGDAISTNYFQFLGD